MDNQKTELRFSILKMCLQIKIPFRATYQTLGNSKFQLIFRVARGLTGGMKWNPHLDIFECDFTQKKLSSFQFRHQTKANQCEIGRKKKYLATKKVLALTPPATFLKKQMTKIWTELAGLKITPFNVTILRFPTAG